MSTRRTPIRPGARFGDLAVREIIGRGAFSTVYLAEDTLLHRLVALKVVDRSHVEGTPPSFELLLREARIVTKLASPHVITLHRVHELLGDLWAFEMEYLAGGSLLQRLEQEGSLSDHETRRILRAVLKALEVAHGRGIVHHDIKPANVLLGDDGSVKLTDFGLGRVIAEGGPTTDDDRRARGTPYYMAPEVVMGLPGTPASDLWSVGVLLYRMLSGRLPFPSKSLASLFLAVQNAMPAPLGEKASPHLASIALRCLAKAPQDRPESATVLLRELGTWTETSTAPTVRPSTIAPSTALVGRDPELDRFRRWADAASDGQGRTVLLLGEAGIGKSALAAEVGHEVRARGFRWIEVRLTAMEGLRRPLLASVQRCLEREAEGTDPERAPAATTEILERLREAEDSDARREILGSTWEIERILATLSKEKPLAVLVEDVHLCEPDEIRTLAGLAASLTASNVLLILTWRTKDPDASDGSDGPPSGYYDLIALPHLERIELEGLPDTAMRLIVEEAAGASFVALEVLERILGESEGIPLYALALYRHLLANGEIEKAGDVVRPTVDWGRKPPPRFIREMVTRRLERLEADERALLETAAVAGAAFDGELLARMVGTPLLTTLRRLQHLYRERALVEPLDHGYRFAHALYRDAIYGDLAPDLRRALHRAYAEALEDRARPEAEDPEALGWHWEQAGDLDRAAPHLRAATHLAVRTGEFDRAWDLARRSGVFAAEATPEELRENLNVLLSLGTRFGSAESVESLEALHARLLDAAEQLQDDEVRRRTQVAIGWDLFQRRGAPAVDRPTLEEAAEHVVHPIARLEALWLLGMLEKQRGRVDAARDLLDRAERTLRPGQRDDLRASLLHTRGLMLRAEAKLPEAVEAFERSAQTRDGGDVHTAISTVMAILTRSERGELDAVDGMEPCIRALERGRQEARAGLARIFQARLLRAAGRTREADAALRRAEPVLEPGRYASGRFQLLDARLRRALRRGEVEEARRVHTAMIETAGAEAAAEDPHVLLQGAFLHHLEGDADEARRRAHHVLDDSPGQATWLNLSDVLVGLAELALLGLELRDVEPRVGALLEDAELPTILALSRDVLRAALHTTHGAYLRAGAEAAEDPRVGHRQAEVAVYGTIFRARVVLLDGEREEAAALLRDARSRARELEHAWLELAALGIAREAGLPTDDPAARSLERILRERNPGAPDRLVRILATWLPSEERS